MEVSKEQVRVLSEMQGLCVPDDELEQVSNAYVDLVNRV